MVVGKEVLRQASTRRQLRVRGVGSGDVCVEPNGTSTSVVAAAVLVLLMVALVLLLVLQVALVPLGPVVIVVVLSGR